MKKLIAFTCFFPLLLSGFLSSCVSSPASRNPSSIGSKKLQVIALTDLHGALEAQGQTGNPLQWGGAAILSTYIGLIESESKIPTVILDAGDNYQGTLVSNTAHGKPVVAFYNYLRVDAVTIGNHDFDYGPGGKIPVVTQPGEDPRGALKARKQEANYPFLAANIRLKSNPDAPVDWAQPSVLLTPAGSDLKVGVVGVATAFTPETTMFENVQDLEFIDVSKEPNIVLREVEKLRAQGADYVILTMHSGGGCTDNSFSKIEDLSTCDVSDELSTLLAQLPEHTLDLVIAGHTHQPMAKMIHDVPTIQPVANSTYLGWVILDKSQSQPLQKLDLIPSCQTAITQGDVTTCDPRQLKKPFGDAHPATFLGHEVTPDPKVLDLLRDDFSRVQKIESEPLGVSTTGVFARNYKGENALGNLISDVLLAHDRDADIVLMNDGGLRADIHKGPLTYGDVFSVLPFDNRLAMVTLNGEQLAKLANHGISGSGGAYSWSKNVTLATAKCNVTQLKVNDQAPGPDQLYKILTTDFLATGGYMSSLVKASGPGAGVKMLNDRQMIRDEVVDAIKDWKGELNPDLFFSAKVKRWTVNGACTQDQ